jgi:ATP-binding cassette subfamily B multidrug efflux pump
MSERTAASPRGPMGGGPMGGRGPMGGGPMGMAMPGAKAKDFRGTMLRLWGYLEPYKYLIMLVVVFALSSSAFSIIGPKILGKATTKLFESQIAYFAKLNLLTDFGYIGRRMLLLLGIYLLSAASGTVQGWIMTGITMKLVYQFRKDISEKINRIPLRYYDGTTHGEVLSRITNDVDTISQTLNQSLTQIITSVATVLGVLIMMLTINVLMTLVTILVVPASVMLISAIVKRSQVYFKQQQEYLGHVNGHVEEIYSGHVVMKLFNGEEQATETFDENNEMLYKVGWVSQFLSGLMQPVMRFVGNLGYVAVCLLGAWLAVKGNIKVGDIQAFIQYVNSFMQPITQIASISNTLQSTAAAAERVFEFLDEEEEVPEEKSPVRLENVHGNVEFRHVRFGYTEDKIIIEDFNESILPGQKVAIVGPTGAGKSTMVKLLMRFYDVSSGAILVDGYDIRSFTRADLRGMFGMVLQDTWQFSGTIMENIRYGRLSATDEEVIAAAKAAYADTFIRTLPDGYNVVLNEDATNISQGQKQLLTIARAILADSPILILDEATSSVDTRTELLIQKAMDTLIQGRTSFVIAHRLSTIRNADLILVMRDGNIVEQGKHEELLAKNGFYAELYNSQFDQADE